MTCAPRFATPRSSPTTRADEITALGAQLGLTLMPWQLDLFAGAMEVDDSGRFTRRSVVVTVPRQQGKSEALLLRAVWTALNVPRSTTVYASQTGSASRMRIREWGPRLIAAGLASGMSLTNGAEHIKFPNGSKILAVSSTPTAGHGLTCELILMDEAMAMVDDRLIQALRPTTISRPNAQIWTVSTVGDAKSTVFHALLDDCREAFRTGQHGRTFYLEFSASPSADPLDPATWATCMPALGLTVTEDVIRAEAESMPIDEFRRAFLNLPTIAATSLFPADAWADCADPTLQLGTPLHLALDMFGGVASIAVASGTTVEIVDERSGALWVVDRVAELVARHNPWTVTLDGGSPTRSLLPELEQRLGPCLTVAGTSDICDAAQLFLADVVEGRLRHIGQGALTSAVEAAVRRPVGDRFAFGRKASSSSVTALVAASLARWQANQHGNGDLRIF